jgi:hypothetical protein
MSEGAEFYQQYQLEAHRYHVEVEPYEDEGFNKWLYQNRMICNGDDLIKYCEDGFTYDEYLRGR